jgi:cell division protein FtsW
MKIAGLHNAANALASLALGEAAGLPMAAMLAALESFPGLPHRSEWIADVAGVRFVDDSKGTNVGATMAAVAGMPGPLVVIAGGLAKGQDFAPLRQAFEAKVRHVVLIGRAAPALAAALQGVCPTETRASMQEAVVGRPRHPQGRYRAAVARVRELRHVSRLRSSRRCVRRGGPRARREPRMMSATLSHGVRARERMPFAWDYVTLGLVASLLLVGLIMVTSASMSVAERDLGNPFYFLERQFVFGAAGVLFAWVVTRVPAELWDRYSLALLCFGLLLLLLVLIPGIGAMVNGARRWLRIGPLNFQVSELAKVLVLTWVCSYCVRKRSELEQTLPGLAKPVGLLTVTAFLLLLEPDFGAATVLFATGFAVLFVAGARLRYVLLLVAAVSLSFAVLALTSAYRLKRLTGFLHPWDDPFNGGFQLTQSLIAIGRGAWFGVGLGSSVQKLFYLPEAHTDFVFAVLAEELGLVGVLGVIALFMALVWRAFQISRMAAQAGMRFQSYLALAFGVWLGLQATVNIGVNMGVLPTKGLTLPLLSYGRSSLLVSLAWLGVLLRIYHEVKCASRAAVTRIPGGVR